MGEQTVTGAGHPMDAITALHERIEQSLTNVRPGPATVEKIEALRVNAKLLGHQIVEMVPGSREQSIALTKLEEATMWAVKGLVLNQPDQAG